MLHYVGDGHTHSENTLLVTLASVKEKSMPSDQLGVQLLRSKRTSSRSAQGAPRKGDRSSSVTASGTPMNAEIDLKTHESMDQSKCGMGLFLIGGAAGAIDVPRILEGICS